MSHGTTTLDPATDHDPPVTAGPRVDIADVSDDELTAEALAADPDRPLTDDAVSFWDLDRHRAPALLPEWYLPAPAAGFRLRGWRRSVAWVVVLAFLAIDAVGLCSTYGPILTGH